MAGRSRFWQYMLFAALGAVLGVVVVMLILQERVRKRRMVAAGSDLAVSPVHAITLHPPQVQAAILPLTITAIPAQFVRRREGTIRVATYPGAICTIEAVYSTGSAPGSLKTDPVIIDESGCYEWTWKIGTGGTHVEVTVHAALEGYEKATARLRVAVGD